MQVKILLPFKDGWYSSIRRREEEKAPSPAQVQMPIRSWAQRVWFPPVVRWSTVYFSASQLMWDKRSLKSLLRQRERAFLFWLQTLSLLLIWHKIYFKILNTFYLGYMCSKHRSSLCDFSPFKWALVWGILFKWHIYLCHLTKSEKIVESKLVLWTLWWRNNRPLC